MDTFRESLSKFDPYQLEAEQQPATDVRDSKIASLQEARQNKTTRFTGGRTPAPVWGTAGIGENDLVKDNYVDSEDGYRDSTANKIFNEYTWEEIDHIKDRVNDEYGIVQVEDGSYVNKKDGTPFTGDLRHYASLYKFKTFEGNDKIGMSSFLSPEERYSEERLKGWGDFIGEKGVDKSQRVDNVLLPRPLTVRLEGIYNGSSDMLNRRAVRWESGEDRAAYDARRDQYGTGATEIYRPKSADEWRELSTEEKDQAWNNFNYTFRPGQRGQYSTEEVAAILKKKHYEESSAVSKMLTRAGNMPKAAASTVLSELIVKPADMVAEWFGGDIGTAEEITAMVDGFFGYDRSFSAEDMQKVHGHVSNLYDAVKSGEDIDMADIYSAAGTILTNPELLVEVAAGTLSFLVGFGKFTKVGKASNLVRKEYQAGKITKEVAQKQIKQIKKDHTLLNNVSHVAASNVGLGLVTAGMVSTNIDEFKENNNGEATAGDIVRITALTSLSSVIEKTAGMFVLRDLPGIKRLGLGKQAKDIKAAVSDMTAAEYATFYNKFKRSAKAVTNVTTAVGASAISEGVTEYVQTLTEITSTKYMSEKYGNDLAEILSSRDSQIDAFTGLALGSVTGGQMSGIGLGVKTGVNRLAQRPQKPTKQATEETTDTGEDEVVAAYEKYKTTSDTLKVVTEINEGNLSAVLKDIDEAKNLSEVASIIDPELAAETNERVKALEAMIADRIEGSNGELSISQALDADKETKPLSDEATIILASRAMRIVVDKYEGEVPEEVQTALYSFASNNKVTEEEAKNIIKSYASVESEATIEDRGVQTRDERLTLYLDSDNPDPGSLKREYSEITNFYRTTEESIAQLTEGLKKAEEEAQRLQARLPKGGKAVVVTTDYMTDPKSSSQGAPFTLSVSYKNGKWGVAQGHIDEVNKRVTAKQRTSASLVKLLERYQQEATSYLDPASMLSFNEYSITAPTNSTDKGIKQEQDYIKAVTEKVRSVLGLPDAQINKVIIGKSADPHWDPAGRRAQENIRITNVVTGKKGSGNYNPSDVVYLHTNNSANTSEEGLAELDSNDSSLAIELDAAIGAGATIVLSNSNRVGKTSDKKADHNKDRGKSLANWFKEKDYMPIGPTGEERNIFVPATDEIKARYEDLKAKNKEASAQKAEQARLEDEIVNLTIERRNKELYKSGRKLREINKDINNITEQLTEQFTLLAKSEVEREVKKEIEEAKAALEEGEAFDEKSVTPTEEQVEQRIATRVKKNINSFLENTVDKNIKEARDLIANNDLTLEGIENEALRNLVDKSIELELGRTEVIETFLSAWNKAVSNKLSGKETLAQLNESMESVGIKVVTKRTENTLANAIVLSKVGNEILNNALTAGNESSIYFVTYVKKGTNDEDIFTTIPYRNNTTRTKVDEVTVVSERKTGDTHTKHGTVVKVSQYDIDPNKYVEIGKRTPLSTIPVRDLPKVFMDIAESTGKSFRAVIAPMLAGEKSFTTNREDSMESLYNLADSPARTLVYDKEGNVNENMLAAMGIAVRSYIERNKRNMIPGYKEDSIIAAMFGVTEDSITDEQRRFAYNNGVLAKTAINNIGQSVLTALGMTRLKDTKQNKDLYARLVADLGNMAVLAAQHENLLRTKDHKTNEYALLTRKGEVLDGEDGNATVAFLEVANTTELSDAVFKRKIPTVYVNDAIAQQAQVEEYIEDAVGARKEPYFGEPIPEKVQKELTSAVRNDITGAGVPADAGKAMKLMMNTEHKLNTDVFNDLMHRLETEEGKLKVMERLGHITISKDNPKYMALTFREKEIQESINDDIEKSVDELIKLHNKIKDNPTLNSIYYPVAFSRVQRYEYVTNTIRTQTDKFHRFFVTPSSFRLKHTINRKNNTFTHTYRDGDEMVTKDTSLLVRAALSQAFGIGIDKEFTREIVNTGNDLLSMTHKEVLEAEAGYMDTGEFVFNNGKEVITLKPDHLSHALVAIKFLKDFTEHPNSKSITSSLSMEYDAITSGFGNKIQQFALIEQLHEEARKIGIIKNDSTAGELLEGQGLNDVFAEGQFSDNYQSLGRMTVEEVALAAPLLPKAEKDVFFGIEKLLPGNELFVDPTGGTVSKALRDLFKPPFMTFNYAAAIASIRKSMNKNIVESIYKEIAKSDLSEGSDAKQVADYLATIVQVNGETVNAKGLQEAIRNIDSRSITVDTTKFKSGSKTEKVTSTVPLETFLAEGVLEGTYGEAVKTVFEKKYSDFIDIQNATTDAFQAAFAVFNQLLVKKVKNHWEANNKTITEDDMSRFIDELRPAFPAIAGPLSKELREGIHVYDIDTLTPNEMMATTPSPQTKLNKEGTAKADTRKVNMLIKSITASLSAGAPAPFLGFDGAQMAKMVNTFHENVLQRGNSAEIIPLHDAYISPLHLMDEAGYQYNKNTVDMHKGYSIMEEIFKMATDAYSIIEGTHKDKSLNLKDDPPTFLDNLKINSDKYSTYSTAVKAAEDSLPELRKWLEVQKKTDADTSAILDTEQQIADVEAVLSFPSQIAQIKNRLDGLNDRINNARKSMYKDGDVIGPMVGLGDSAYVIGREENRAGTAVADHYRESNAYTAGKRTGEAENLGEHKVGKINHDSTKTDVYEDGSYYLLELNRPKQAGRLSTIVEIAINSNANVLFKVENGEVLGAGAKRVYDSLKEREIATSKSVKINGDDYLLLARKKPETDVLTEDAPENTADSDTKEPVDVDVVTDNGVVSMADITETLNEVLDMKDNNC